MTDDAIIREIRELRARVDQLWKAEDMSAGSGWMLAVGVAGQYLAGAGAGTVPAWATLNQAAVAGLTTGDSPTFVTAKLTGLTDGYVPYHVSDVAGLANSGFYWDAVNQRGGIGTTEPGANLEVNGSNYGISVNAFIAENYGFLSTNNSDVSIGRNIKTKPGVWAKNDSAKASSGMVFGADGSVTIFTSPTTQTGPLYTNAVTILVGGNVRIGTLAGAGDRAVKAHSDGTLFC